MRLALLPVLLLASCAGDGGPGLSPAPPPPPGGGAPLPPPAPAPPPPPPPAPGGLAGGVLATFQVGTETFRVWVTNAATIDDLFALQAGTLQATIPSGKLAQGAGQADHNAPYSWHLDPEDVQLVELAIEACDGRPSDVEGALQNYLNVGRYCPWSAQLAQLQDFR